MLGTSTDHGRGQFCVSRARIYNHWVAHLGLFSRPIPQRQPHVVNLDGYATTDAILNGGRLKVGRSTLCRETQAHILPAGPIQAHLPEDFRGQVQCLGPVVGTGGCPLREA